jgi:hypothetical protein
VGSGLSTVGDCRVSIGDVPFGLALEFAAGSVTEEVEKFDRGLTVIF